MNRIYHVKDDYFEKLNNERKAYFIGLISADGCIKEEPLKKRARYLCITLSGDDYYLINELKKDIAPTAILYCEAIRNPKHQIQHKLQVTSQKLCDDLLKYNITPRKSLTLKFPEVDSKWYPHIIRGYFDGDGTITSFQRKVTQKPQLNIQIVGTYEYLESVSIILNQYAGMTRVKVAKYPKENNHRLCICGNRNIFKFYSYIYTDSTICLKRKKERMKIVTSFYN